MTSCAPRSSATNDTTRIRRVPAEYAVETRRMPKINLAALLAETGAHAPFVGFIPREIREPKPTRRGVPRYRPPAFARLYAAARFRWPGLFAKLRVLVVIHALSAPPFEAHHVLDDGL